jgi:hypothetical protein
MGVQVEELERAKQVYDKSCAISATKDPKPVRVSLSGIAIGNDESEEIDPDDVRKAREYIWRQIPKFCRKAQAELLARIKDRRILDAVNSWDWESPNLIISAPLDFAKTSAVALILLRLMSKGREREYRKWRRIRWYGMSQLMNAAKEWPLGSGACPDIRAASNCELLVLDDVGNDTSWQSTAFDFLQSRYERGLSNIITTGLRLQELRAGYGDHLVKRMAKRDGKLGTIVNCWDDK